MQIHLNTCKKISFEVLSITVLTYLQLSYHLILLYPQVLVVFGDYLWLDLRLFCVNHWNRHRDRWRGRIILLLVMVVVIHRVVDWHVESWGRIELFKFWDLDF